jgi:hypothetical protein
MLTAVPRRYSALLFADEMPPRVYTGEGRDLEDEQLPPAARWPLVASPQLPSADIALPPCLATTRRPFEQTGGLGQCARSADPVVTLMMQNIPCRCSIGEVIYLIQESGFRGCFEYLFMPTKASDRRNKGFVFVAFASARQSLLFQCAVDGTRVSTRTSTKEIIVTSARAAFSLEQMQAPSNAHVLQTRWGPILIPPECVFQF